MAVNTSISLVGLDFDVLKSNLKNHLKNNTPFRDYDFEGSNINVLVDLLAYNTYLNSFYTNMVSSEMFLDTAQLRDSIVSHAKELNYLPRSYSSARATITIGITPSSSVQSVLIPKGTTFLSKVQNNNYNFVTDQNLVINTANASGAYVTNLDLYEGSYVTDTFVYNTANTSQRFAVSNPTVDLSSVTVTLIEDSGSTVQNYVRATSLFGVTSTSKIYFIQPAENGQYEVVFGDDIFGRKPLNGSVAVIEYRICSGELPNGASTFVNDSSIDSHTNVAITTVTSAVGGAVSESIESIRFNAPRAVATQERAVTSNDYKTLLQIQFPDIQAVNVYGGEDADPPQYGTVFISVDIQNADGVPETNKAIYREFIKTRTPLTITPEFIDPEFTYIDVNSIIKYNVNVTNKQIEEIKTLVRVAINDYSDSYLNDFESTLRYSQLVRAIDESDTSIVSNETNVRALKILSAPTLKFGTPTNYTIKFDIPLSEEHYVTSNTFNTSALHTIESSSFLFNGQNCVIRDNIGVLNIVTEEGSLSNIVKPIGSVDFSTGTVTISNFNPSEAFGGRIKFYAIPASKDISCRKNVILRVLEEDINLDAERVRE